MEGRKRWRGEGVKNLIFAILCIVVFDWRRISRVIRETLIDPRIRSYVSLNILRNNRAFVASSKALTAARIGY